GGIPRDVKRAVALLRRAAADGSALATFDLGVLAQEHVEGTPAEALHAFRKATELGEPRGYRAAAVLLDEGRGVPKAPERAARLLLEGVALDGGDLLAELSSRAGDWSKPTLMALQSE